MLCAAAEKLCSIVAFFTLNAGGFVAGALDAAGAASTAAEDAAACEAAAGRAESLLTRETSGSSVRAVRSWLTR
jgi:hypothetical protein